MKDFALKHPWLTVLFIVPAAAGAVSAVAKSAAVAIRGWPKEEEKPKTLREALGKLTKA